MLHLSEARPGEEREGPAHGTFDHAAFRCTDRAAYESQLAKRGIPYRTALVPETQVLQVFFKDPAGNGVELNFEEQDG